MCHVQQAEILTAAYLQAAMNIALYHMDALCKNERQKQGLVLSDALTEASRPGSLPKDDAACIFIDTSWAHLECML